MDELAIGRRTASRRPSSNSTSTCRREAVDATRLDGGRLYPEWDYRTGAYLQDHCRVLTGPAPENGEAWAPERPSAGTSGRCGGGSRRCGRGMR